MWAIWRLIPLKSINTASVVLSNIALFICESQPVCPGNYNSTNSMSFEQGYLDQWQMERMFGNLFENNHFSAAPFCDRKHTSSFKYL